MFRKLIIQALEDRYEAEISAAHATINIYLTNSVGIGEHPQHLDEIDKQFDIELHENVDDVESRHGLLK